MMRVSMERGTRRAASSPSSPIWGTEITSAPASRSPSAAPNKVLARSAAEMRRRQHVGNVGGDGEAAHGHHIGIDQMAFQEDGDGGEPPPMSITVAPICFSSSLRVARPEA